VSIPPLFCGFR